MNGLGTYVWAVRLHVAERIAAGDRECIRGFVRVVWRRWSVLGYPGRRL